MTPRVLLTAIGATAIGFAIAIGSAAGFTTGATTPASTAATSSQAVHTTALAGSAADTASMGATASQVRTTFQSDDCPIAL